MDKFALTNYVSGLQNTSYIPLKWQQMWFHCLRLHNIGTVSGNTVKTTPTSIMVHIDNKILGQLLCVETSVQTKWWGRCVWQKQTPENKEVISLTSWLTVLQ
jgi:hypothetical protein